MIMKLKTNVFHFTQFSKKQLQVLTWWVNPSTKDNEAIICDGSVRAGKTVIMSLSYVMWAMHTFDGQQLGMAGKTIGSFRRNVLRPLKQMLAGRGYKVIDHRTDNMFEVVKNGKANYFFIFGGKDEASQDLVQGLTAAGFFFDEVALMPQSFVNQATARVSVSGGKYWFNMNPEGPYHWFKMNWIDDLKGKRALRIHFRMEDNPSLSEDVIDRYKRNYSGVFYQRYILGLWVMSEGVIYDNFNRDTMVVDKPPERCTKYYVSIDYGTQNPTVFLLWGFYDGVWYCLKEYYYDGRHSSRQKTDDQYADDLDNFVGELNAKVIIDPSAASFIAVLRSRHYRIIRADNDVLNGIRETQSAMNNGLIKFTPNLKNVFKELASYVWDEKASNRGEDKVVKEHDHAMDAMRYFVYMVIRRKEVKVIRNNYI
ncbi:PBSX family phage terminase large subunit [Pediococcus acidilactici]|nr:PBSX family phage terminase large subunit [Pediococcus acidilactici]QQC15285.1 PBSX family phage terminase large subunit [Pediococcus acidilactici]